MMVFITNGKTTCFGLQRPSSGFDNFLAKRVLYNMPKLCSDVEISSSFHLLLFSSVWWDVCYVNEFVGSWVWIFPTQLERSTPSYLQIH